LCLSPEGNKKKKEKEKETHRVQQRQQLQTFHLPLIHTLILPGFLSAPTTHPPSLNRMGVKSNLFPFFLFFSFFVVFIGIEVRMSLNRMGVKSDGEPRITGDVTVFN
jgi:hypothetical protein